MSKITFEDFYSDLTTGEFEGMISPRYGSGVNAVLGVKNLSVVPDSDIVMKIECLGKLSVFTYGGLTVTQPLQYSYCYTPDPIDGFSSNTVYQINSQNETSPFADMPTAPGTDYQAEIKIWFEDYAGRYESSDVLTLTIQRSGGSTSGTETSGTVSYVSSTIGADTTPRLTAPAFSISGMELTMTSAEGKSIFWKKEGEDYQLYTAPIALTETIEILACVIDPDDVYRNSDVVRYEAVPMPQASSGPFHVKTPKTLPVSDTLTGDSRLLIQNGDSISQIKLDDLRRYFQMFQPGIARAVVMGENFRHNNSLTGYMVQSDYEGQTWLIVAPSWVSSSSSAEYMLFYYSDIASVPTKLSYPSGIETTTKPHELTFFNNRFYVYFLNTRSWYVLEGGHLQETTDPMGSFEGSVLAVTKDYVYTNVGKNTCPGSQSPGRVYRYTISDGTHVDVTDTLPGDSSTSIGFFPFESQCFTNLPHFDTLYYIAPSSGGLMTAYYSTDQGLTFNPCSVPSGWYLYPYPKMGDYYGKKVSFLVDSVNNLAIGISEDGINFTRYGDSIIVSTSYYHDTGTLSFNTGRSIAYTEEYLSTELSLQRESTLAHKGDVIYAFKDKIITVESGSLYYMIV